MVQEGMGSEEAGRMQEHGAIKDGISWNWSLDTRHCFHSMYMPNDKHNTYKYHSI